MRPWLPAMSLIALVSFGCAKKQAQPVAHSEQSEPPLTQFDTSPRGTTDPYATDPYATDPYASDTAAPSWSRGTEPKSGGGTKETTLIDDAGRSGTRTHVVQKGDTFYKLARQYYNDQSKWKDIWEANKTRVPDKNKLEVGTKLIIP